MSQVPSCANSTTTWTQKRPGFHSAAPGLTVVPRVGFVVEPAIPWPVCIQEVYVNIVT